MSTILTAAPTPRGPAPLSTGWIIFLHLLPKIAGMLGYLLLIPVFRGSNMPTVWVVAMPSLFMVVPLELGILLWLGRREHGRLTLGGIVLNKDRTPFVHYLWLVPLLVAWFLFATIGIGTSLSKVMPGLFQPWLPELMPKGGELLPTPAQLAAFSPGIFLGVTAILLLLRSLVGSAVDEYYYRGYLLPRMAHLGGWAPLVSGFFSSLSFAGAPWQTLLPIVGLLPAIYAVWWQRNLRIIVCTRWIYCALDALRLLLNYSQVV